MIKGNNGCFLDFMTTFNVCLHLDVYELLVFFLFPVCLI